MRKLILLLSGSAAIAVASGSALRGQTIGGQIVDRLSNRPMALASITLRDSLAKTITVVRADSVGMFYVDAPRPGLYSLAFMFDNVPFGTSDSIRLADGQFYQSVWSVGIERERVYSEYEVTKPVTAFPGNQFPRPPMSKLKDGSALGRVETEFVVDTAGRVDMSTFKIVRSTSDELARMYRSLAPGLRFEPAELNGRHVRQLTKSAFAVTVEQTTIVMPGRPY